MNGFLSMLYDSVDKSATVKTDELIGRTINNMIGETIYADYAAAALNSKSGVKARNLLYEFKQANSSYSSLTAADAIHTPDFLRYASVEIALTADRMGRMSTLFNVGGTAKFTPRDYLHIILLSDFAKGAEGYLQSGTYHDQFVALPAAETVPYWQGSGTGYAFGDVSKVYITTTGSHTINTAGILGVMFDRDALGVCNPDRRVTTQYNAKAEFYNFWYKFDAQYFNDLNENFVVFFA